MRLNRLEIILDMTELKASLYKIENELKTNTENQKKLTADMITLKQKEFQISKFSAKES